MSTRLILIRHGQTDWSCQRRYCSLSDIGLNEKGKAQARKLLERLEKERIDKVYSSDARRAIQFAKMVFRNRVIKECAAFREMNFGVLEGLTHEEIMDKYPKIYREWLSTPNKTVIPEGESLNALAKRTAEALRKLLSSNNDKTIAILTHAGPIKVILCNILNLDLKEIWQIKVDLASISMINFVKGKSKIISLNDTSYLNG